MNQISLSWRRGEIPASCFEISVLIASEDQPNTLNYLFLQHFLDYASNILEGIYLATTSPHCLNFQSQNLQPTGKH